MFSGFDVAVNHTAFVRVLQRVRDFTRELHGIRDWQLRFAVQSRAQRFTFDEWHDVEQLTIGAAGIEERQDMRMLQIR